MEWVLLAAAAAALQWIVETVLTAGHERWRRRHTIPLAATLMRRFDSWLFALDVATLLYVQAMLVVFLTEVALQGWVADGVAYLVIFGGLTGYLWTVARRRWRRLSP